MDPRVLSFSGTLLSRLLARAFLALLEVRPHLAGRGLLLRVVGEGYDLLGAEEAHHRLAGAAAILAEHVARLGIVWVEIGRLPLGFQRRFATLREVVEELLLQRLVGDRRRRAQHDESEGECAPHRPHTSIASGFSISFLYALRNSAPIAP